MSLNNQISQLASLLKQEINKNEPRYNYFSQNHVK